MIKCAKRITSIVISVLLILTMAFTVSASDNYKSWVQSDSRWGNKRLGNCSETMSEIGCAVTSVAILAVHSGSVSETNFNPGILCDFLSKNDGFDNYGNLYWGAVSKLVPDFTFKKRADISASSEDSLTKLLANYINQGYYIVLSVEHDNHWVAIDTIKDGEVYMMDPAQNKTNKLFDYYDLDGMLQVRLYNGKNSPASVTTNPGENTQNPLYLTGHYKTTDILNLRSSYSTNASVLNLIPKNTTVVVTRIYNNQWGQVEYNGKTGWIYLEYTNYTENEYSYKTGYYKVNEKSGVYLRRGIGTQSTQECLVPYNDQLKIDLVTANWGRAIYGEKAGWICMEYVTFVSTSEPAVTTTVTSTKVTTKATTTTTVTSTTTATQLPLIKGDVNRDGKFSKTDLILLNEYIAKPVKVRADIHNVMDVNGDNVIDERDSVYLMKIINKGN